MKKLDKISKVQSAIKKAPLKTSDKANKNIVIYNIPVSWVETIKENGFSFSSYAKMAVMEKMKKDGIL